MAHYYSEAEVVASIDGLTVRRLRAFVAAECVRPDEREGRLAFGDTDLARLELLTELARDFDLDEEAAAMVMSLIDQIHGLRRQMRALAQALEQESDEVRARLGARLSGRS